MSDKLRLSQLPAGIFFQMTPAVDSCRRGDRPRRALNLEFPAMRRLSISTAHAFLLVYSIDDRASFDEVRRLWEQIKEERTGYTELPCVVAGNKVAYRCGCVRVLQFIDVINVYKRFLIKKEKCALTLFILLTFFLFSTGKITQITFPGCSDIGNVLTIKDKDKF